jgi:DNA-binding GntR family transcriptional regulator
MDDSNPAQRLYVRLAESLRAEMASGLLAPGSKVPSITSLCKLHGLSRRVDMRCKYSKMRT